MADPEKQPEKPKAVQHKLVIANKVTGTVKWFNVKSGYGFINRNDTKEDVFVHQSAIIKNNPRKAVRSVGDGEIVEFDVVIGEKGHEAANVTGPSGEAVKGSPYAADKRRGFRGVHWYTNQRRGNTRTQIRPREGQEGYESGEGRTGDEVNTGEGTGRRRRYRTPRAYDGYYRGSRRTGPQVQHGDNSVEGGEQGDEGTGESVPRGGGRGRGRGGPSRRFFRRNFRGVTRVGPPVRHRSQDDQVTDNEDAVGSSGLVGGPQMPPRPRYRRRMPRHPRPTSSQQTMSKDSHQYGAGISNSIPKSPRPRAPVTKTFPRAPNLHAKSEQKSDAPNDKDTPAPTSAPEESQPVQNTTTESTA